MDVLVGYKENILKECRVKNFKNREKSKDNGAIKSDQNDFC